MEINCFASYQNVLESLVAEEVERQLQHLPSQLVKYLQNSQIIAYALNRLPPLYATSQEGWERQQQLAKNQLQPHIVVAVRQGIAVVVRDPLKISTPLN